MKGEARPPSVDGVTRDREGLALCALSALGFGAMAVLAKLAYGEGVGVLELLAVRFVVAASVLGSLARRELPRGRAAARGLALGAVVYAAEAGLFFASLTRMGAAPAELLLYAYPSLVVLGAVALRRERGSGRKVGALLLASAGVGLVLLGAGAGSVDPLGAALALASAAAYAGYILLADAIRLPPRALAALVCAGAAVSFTLAGAVSGTLALDWSPAGWALVVGIAVASTVVPLTAFLAGMDRIGPGWASILSTLEPPVTVSLAFLAFGETLGALQLAGGALVLAAVAVLQVRRGAPQEPTEVPSRSPASARSVGRSSPAGWAAKKSPSTPSTAPSA